MFFKLNESAIIPQYQTKGSVGLDLHSIESLDISPGNRAIVSTGLGIELPFGHEGQVRPRSGLAAKFGITVLNTPGTIDSDYRGEIKVILYNTSISTFSIEKGDRIAQMVIAPVVIIPELLNEKERNVNGFGSTGV